MQPQADPPSRAATPGPSSPPPAPPTSAALPSPRGSLASAASDLVDRFVDKQGVGGAGGLAGTRSAGSFRRLTLRSVASAGRLAVDGTSPPLSAYPPAAHAAATTIQRAFRAKRATLSLSLRPFCRYGAAAADLVRRYVSAELGEEVFASRARLVLHFDVNKTIIMSDDAQAGVGGPRVGGGGGQPGVAPAPPAPPAQSAPARSTALLLPPTIPGRRRGCGGQHAAVGVRLGPAGGRPAVGASWATRSRPPRGRPPAHDVSLFLGFVPPPLRPGQRSGRQRCRPPREAGPETPVHGPRRAGRALPLSV